ncbi:MAG: polysaccharide biosynthesis/export family protein [Nevskiales bacterium]|nr:polysaccharide biosynthesis/export family protein [Nevskiales bacterium]
MNIEQGFHLKPSRGVIVHLVSKGSALLAALLVSACSILPGMHLSSPDSAARAGDGGAPEYRVVEVSGQSLQQIRRETEGIWPPLPPSFQSVTPAKRPDEYVIGPGDVVHVTVWDHPELTVPTGSIGGNIEGASRLVSSDGKMFYPYVGEFQAAGMTVLELRDYLARSLARVIASPQVDARVIAFRAQRIQVTGEVAQPGVVTLDDTPKGILEAISERGGLAQTASRRRVLLRRHGETYPIDLGGLLSGSRPVMNPKLEAGDVIHVPDQSNDLVFVLGETEKQASVVLQQGRTTLTEALAEVGGMDKLRADDAGVLVFRRPFAEGLPPTIYSLELDNPLGLLLAGEFVLQPRDVVYVKATDFAKYNSVIGQLLPTISAVFQIDRLVNN